MLQFTDCAEKKISSNATLLQNQKLTAGRQNLLSAIWRGRNATVAGAMPNGDPPSLMLWGAEDQMSRTRHNTRQGVVHGKKY